MDEGSPMIQNLNRERCRWAIRSEAIRAALATLLICGFAGACSPTSEQARLLAKPRTERTIADAGRWIAWSDKDGIWARNPTGPGDYPADTIRLSSTPGIPSAWSPDGCELLVVRSVRDRKSHGLQPSQLFVLNSGGTETRLTDKKDWIGGASFSPDGTQVVYAAYSAIKVVDAMGGSSRVLLESGDQDELQEPKWSPDGSQIAYFSGGGDHGHSVRVMASDGTDSRLVVENSATLGIGHVVGLEWSPDSSQLALLIESGLYVVGVDGSGFRLVTDDEQRPSWYPDSAEVAHTRGATLDTCMEAWLR
jgi:dipeptidyl aminopeptidase/acylaminoacyl peptidase